MGQPFVVVFPAASAVSIAAAQTLAGAGAIVINGPLLSLPDFAVGVRKAVLSTGSIPNVQRVLTYTSLGNISGANITAVGFDLMGNAVTDTRAAPSSNTVATTSEFAIVTGITSDAALGTAMSVGTGSTGKTAWCKTDQFRNPANITVAVAITTTASVTVQDTPSDVETVASPTVFSHPTLVTLAASAESNYAFPPAAIRAAMNSSSGSGAFTLTIIQAGSK